LPDTLILVEHPAVYTQGRGEESLAHLKSETFYIERGGQATYHNPGQLVAYPILTLEDKNRDLHLYLRTLEEALIQTLEHFDIQGMRKEKATGVWVGEGKYKIASLGVAVRKWITYHGIALNVKNDLSGFFKINPCGFDAQVMTSMEKFTGRPFEMQAVKEVFVKFFLSL